MFFTTIGIKTPKCMQSFIWANETKFPETDLLNVYKCVRHQNAKKKNMEIALYGYTKQHYEKPVFGLFLSYLRTETPNLVNITLYC